MPFKKRTKDDLLKALYSFLGVVLLIAIWEIISFSAGKDIFPEFFNTLGNMFSLFAEQLVWVSLGYSIMRIVIALAISFVLGALLGLLAAFFPALERILSPFIYFLTAFPTASMIFILIIYTKITPQLLVGFLTFPIIYKAALRGGKIIISSYMDPIRLEGRYSFRNFSSVLMPLSLPYLSMGLAQASGLALKSEIMGEVFISSNKVKGIGILINAAYNTLDMERLLALTLLAILFMSLVDLVIYFVKKALTAKFGIEQTKTYHMLNKTDKDN